MPISNNLTRFVAQVDVGLSVQDYAPFSGCVRLIGVSGSSFDKREFNLASGCATYFIDLGLADLFRLLRVQVLKSQQTQGRPELALSHRGFLDLLAGETRDLWLDIKFKLSTTTTGAYAYETFTAEEPRYLSITSVSLISGPPPSAPSSGVISWTTSRSSLSWELTAFHVGQGMCSLAQESGGSAGYLLDAGAGTPVRRSEYIGGWHASGQPFINELMTAGRVNGLSSLSAILSHPDSDHWRLLDWDSSLLSAVSKVYLPSGVPALAFRSPRVLPKVLGVSSANLIFNTNNSLDVYRSKPSIVDRNGDCLVVFARFDQKEAMLSGDYVYDRMATDGVSAISSTSSGTYDAIVVPHHGDAASANRVPAPVTPNVSKAFFSAGTHAGYGHPTAVSIAAHSGALFDVVDQHTLDDVLEHPLI